MGTIAEKLQKLLSTKEAIKQAIINKGVSVSDADTFSSYANKIEEITVGSEATLIEKTIEENGTYNASDDSADGYSSVIVNVPTSSDDIEISDASYLFYANARIEDIDKYYARIKDCVNYNYTFASPKLSTTVDVKKMLEKCAESGCSCSNMFNSSAYTSAFIFQNILEADYSKVSNMEHMFYYCQNSSIGIDIILKDIVKVTSMKSAFSSAYIKNIDLSQANNSVCSYMQSAFAYSKIKKATFGGMLYKGINAGYMFQNCSYLAEIEWNNFCPSSLSYALNNCKAITSVDFSNLDSSMLTDISNIFSGCTNLVEILNLNIPNVKSASNFLGTSSLNSLNRITFKQGTTFGNSTISSEIILNLARATIFDADGYTEMINSLGVNESGYVRTIKLNTTLYNSLTDEQKALATDKGYTLAYGTS